MFILSVFENIKFNKVIRIILCGLAALALLLTTNNALAYPGITGTLIFGQPNSTSNEINNGGVSAKSLSSPYGIVLDSGGNLYVADGHNNRVLYYSVGKTTATRVIGQPDFTSTGAGVANNRFNFPEEVALDSSGGLYVSDRDNNRVLYFPKDSSTATRVIGQPNFTTNSTGLSASKFNRPTGLAVTSNGGLYVADLENSRVLFFPPGATTASRVYGQPNFTSKQANNGGISATSLYAPFGVSLDNSGGLYIADTLNQRVLHYSGSSTTADFVYGQYNFNTNYQNQNGGSMHDLSTPTGMVIDGSGGLYIADMGNGRVLHFAAGSTTAFYKYGKPEGDDRIPSDSFVTAQTLKSPYNVAVSPNGGLYVSDFYDNRVVFFPQPNPASVILTASSATLEYGQTLTLKAQVTAPGGGGVKPTGKVTFISNKNPGTLGTVPVGEDGSATITVPYSSLYINNYSFAVIYTGDYNFSYTRSAPTSVEVIRPRVTLTLSSPTTAANIDDNVTYYVTMLAPPNMGYLNGEVRIIAEASNTVAGGYGSADIYGNIAPIPVHFYHQGNYKVRATYVSGPQTFEPATSNILDLVVRQPTTLSLTSSGNPTTYGDNITLEASLGWTRPNQVSTDPTSQINFKSDGVSLGKVGFNSAGKAQLSLANLPGGTHNLTAEYEGDSIYGASITTSLSQVVNRLDTQLQVNSSTMTPNYGQLNNISATLTHPAGPATPPTGQVTFKEGAKILKVGMIDTDGNAAFSAWNLDVGNHTIVVEYGGDINYKPSTASPIILNVTIPASWQVTSTSDDGTGTVDGTFSYALKQANTTATKYVTFNAGLTSIDFTGGIVPAVGNGVVIYGGCSSGPEITFNGSGLAAPNYGLVLDGGTIVMGIEIKGFGSPALKFTTTNNSSPNLVTCVKAG